MPFDRTSATHWHHFVTLCLSMLNIHKAPLHARGRSDKYNELCGKFDIIMDVSSVGASSESAMRPMLIWWIGSITNCVLDLTSSSPFESAFERRFLILINGSFFGLGRIIPSLTLIIHPINDKDSAKVLNKVSLGSGSGWWWQITWIIRWYRAVNYLAEDSVRRYDIPVVRMKVSVKKMTTEGRNEDHSRAHQKNGRKKIRVSTGFQGSKPTGRNPETQKSRSLLLNVVASLTWI